jgi:hypothetical protein
MNFLQLLHQRDALLRQARLANLAFAHERLGEFARRLGRAGVAGPVSLHPVDPEADRFLPVLVAHAASQAVIDEHFLDEDAVELADILGFLSDEGLPVDFTFTAGDLADRWLPLLGRELARGGVRVPGPAPQSEDSRRSAG